MDCRKHVDSRGLGRFYHRSAGALLMSTALIFLGELSALAWEEPPADRPGTSDPLKMSDFHDFMRDDELYVVQSTDGEVRGRRFDPIITQKGAKARYGWTPSAWEVLSNDVALGDVLATRAYLNGVMRTADTHEACVPDQVVIGYTMEDATQGYGARLMRADTKQSTFIPQVQSTFWGRHIGYIGDKDSQGVAVNQTNGDIFVSDPANDQVHCYDKTNHHKFTFGSFGWYGWCFNDPQGLAVSDDGQFVFTTDLNNYRFQMWSAVNGDYKRAWEGGGGNGERGYFKRPIDAVSAGSIVYILDETGDYYIQSFDFLRSNWRDVRNWRYKPDDSGGLGNIGTPLALSRDNIGQVYMLTDTGAGLDVLIYDWQLDKCLHRSTLKGVASGLKAHGLAVMPDNTLWITVEDDANASFAKGLHAFDYYGNYLGHIAAPTGASSELSGATDLCVDGYGRLFVAANNQVEIIEPHYATGFLGLEANDIDYSMSDNSLIEFRDEVLALFQSNGKLVLNVYNNELSLLHSYEVGACGADLAFGATMEIGDFTGDAQLDVAVIYFNGAKSICVDLLTHPKSGAAGELVEISHQATEYSYWEPSEFTSANGDFDGDGSKELAWYSIDSKLHFFKYSANDKGFHHAAAIKEDIGGIGARVVAGKIIPQLDLGPVEQVAIIRGNSCREWSVEAFSLDEQLSKLSSVSNVTSIGKVRMPDLLPGSFDLDKARINAGTRSLIAPTMGGQYLDLHAFVADLGAKQLVKQVTDAYVLDSHHIGGFQSAVAADLDGDSVILGRPMHLVMNHTLSMDYIVGEPPKHLDIIPVNPQEPDGERQMLMIASIGDFNVSLTDTQSNSMQQESTSTSSKTFGGGADINLGFNYVGLLAAFNVGLHQTLNGSVNTALQQINSSYQTETTSEMTQTNGDDFLKGKYKNVDIWRYPIYAPGALVQQQNGQATTQPVEQGYVDIVIPWKKTQTFNHGGVEHDVRIYQPVHENHNLLSYPQFTEDWPQDVGSFTTASGEIIKDTMAPMSTYTLDRNTSVIDLQFSEQSGSTSAKTVTNNFSSSTELTLDVNIGAQMSAPPDALSNCGPGGQIHVAGNFNYDNTWSNAATNTRSLSRSTGVQITKPSNVIDSSTSYDFQPAVYVDTSGTFKVSHAVNLKNPAREGFTFFRDHYGQNPDLGLNLPHRFKQITMVEFGQYLTVWRVNRDQNDMARHQMRGFYICDNDDREVPITADLIAGKADVKLVARIYNFSTQIEARDFDVLFEATEFDTRRGVPVDMNKRTELGRVRVNLLQPLENTKVSLPWAVPETWGGDTRDTYRSYMFVVTLDPDNRVPNEIHELDAVTPKVWYGNDESKTDTNVPHGNNWGYWPKNNGICIYHKDSQAAKAWDESQGYYKVDEDLEHEVYLPENAIAIFDEEGNQIDEDAPVLELNTLYKVRTTVVSSRTILEPRFLQYFVKRQGDPDDRIEEFALDSVGSLMEGENTVWTSLFLNSEEDLGEWDLFARVALNGDEIESDSNEQYLPISVVYEKRPAPLFSCNEDKRATGAPLSAAMGGDVLVLGGLLMLTIRQARRKKK